MQTLVFVIHILAALAIVVLVLVQHGKGADMGAAFGSGSAGSLFGSAGASNFLSKSTALLATVFFATSLALTYFAMPSGSGGVTERLSAPAGKAQDTVPAAPASSAPAPSGAPQEKSAEIPK